MVIVCLRNYDKITDLYYLNFSTNDTKTNMKNNSAILSKWQKSKKEEEEMFIEVYFVLSYGQSHYKYMKL
jgi:hypothetical protein